MQKIRGNKWNRRICKWIASLLTVALLVNQSSLSVLAEEIGEAVCQCDTRCSADSVNGGCPVCAQDYGRCEGAEDVTDTDTGEEPENPDEGEGVDAGTGEGTENPGGGEGDTDADTETTPDTGTDEETEDSDAGEDEDVNTDADTEVVSDVDGEAEGDALLQDGEAENVNGGNAVSPTAVGDTFNDGVFTYKIIKEEGNDRQVEVTGHVNGILASGELVIPPVVLNGTNEYGVVGIGEAAFHSCVDLTSITLPDSVTSIGGSAFELCTRLESITIPDGVTNIEERVLYNCMMLNSITLPDSVISIGEFVFHGCVSLTSITIPDSVTNIGQSAFGQCSSLESITIPDSVTNIGRTAFANCSSLANIKILNENIDIGENAFVNCEQLNSLQIALTENITGTPTVGYRCFEGCPEDRYLTLLTKDGTTVLSDTTTPTLAAAVKAYDKADGPKDGKWYGWNLPDDPDPDGPSATNYPVTIKVNKDGSEWNDCEKTFALSTDGVNFTTNFTAVPAGTYTIYDTTGATDSADYDNTYVTVDVTNAAVDVTVNYYTVTFYDDDTPFGEPQIVLNNTTLSEPSDSPTKDGYTFYRWVTSKDGSEEFDFINTKITAKTDIYASWIKAEEKTFTITASAGDGGSVSPSGAVTVKSGDDQQFTITPDDGYRVSSVLVDDVEQLNSTQAINHARAGIADAENNAKTYTFENVTDNHSLTAAFTAIGTGGGGSGDNGDDDDPDDNNGGGGSGGGSGTGGSGGGGNTGGGSDGSEGGGSGGSDDIGGDGADGSSNPDGSGNGAQATVSDTSVKNGTNVINVSNTAPASKDSEPKTGDASHMEIYATIAMIAGLSYILLYFADGKNGMTEEEKKEIVAALVAWAKNGSRVKKYAALAVIFLILVYYHSIGKRTTVDWKEVYER